MPFVVCCALVYFWTLRFSRIGDFYTLRLGFFGNLDLRIINYRTEKKPVRMEYLDDIDIPEFKELPTFKRMCICILKNDHTCKYMGFSLNKAEKEQKERVMEKYKALI